MKKLIALLIIFTLVMSLEAAWALDRSSDEAKGPTDTFIFQPFYLIEKALTPPDNYEEQFHKTIEQEMQEEHLKAKKAKAEAEK